MKAIIGKAIHRKDADVEVTGAVECTTSIPQIFEYF